MWNDFYSSHYPTLCYFLAGFKLKIKKKCFSMYQKIISESIQKILQIIHCSIFQIQSESSAMVSCIQPKAEQVLRTHRGFIPIVSFMNSRLQKRAIWLPSSRCCVKAGSELIKSYLWDLRNCTSQAPVVTLGCFLHSTEAFLRDSWSSLGSKC